jgi:hypothetical protein
MHLPEVRRTVSRHSAETQPAGVHPLHVDGRQGSLESVGDLDRDGDAAAGDSDHERSDEAVRGEGLREDASGGRAIAEERLDPGNETHSVDSAVPTDELDRAPQS